MIDPTTQFDQVNFGSYVIRPEPCPDQCSVLATGLGRSGTTMLARILSELGIFMGENMTEAYQEDQEFLALVKAKDHAGFATLCRKRDLVHDKWGFKCPAARSDLPGFTRQMRNPRAVIVFRDIMATSLRNTISIQMPTLKALETAARGNVSLVQQVIKADVPTLMLSYEKVLQFPTLCVHAIAEHCGIDIGDGTARRIAGKCIRNGDSRYLAGSGTA